MKAAFILLFLQLLAGYIFAHGENKPGPHGGFVEMSKNIHTEVNPDKDGSFHIFLLDGNMENPTIKNSSLSASIKSGKKEVKLDCTTMGGTHFHCKPKAERPKDGQLILNAKRDGVIADPITYQLATLKPAEAKKEDHSHH